MNAIARDAKFAQLRQRTERKQRQKVLRHIDVLEFTEISEIFVHNSFKFAIAEDDVLQVLGERCARDFEQIEAIDLTLIDFVLCILRWHYLGLIAVTDQRNWHMLLRLCL